MPVSQKLTNVVVLSAVDDSPQSAISHYSFLADLFQGNFGFDQDLFGWDSASVTTMAFMFDGASSFTGQGINNWDVSSVADFQDAFKSATSFNPSLSGWVVASATNMNFMFYAATSFTGSGLSGWNVGNTRSLFGTFNGASQFTEDISLWDISSVTDFALVLSSASAFNIDLCSWGTKITNTGASTSGAFVDSGCNDPSDPNLLVNPKGPFCHACL